MERGAWQVRAHGVEKSQTHFRERPTLAFTLMFDAPFHTEAVCRGTTKQEVWVPPLPSRPPPLPPHPFPAPAWLAV